jgi:hypothetical protein
VVIGRFFMVLPNPSLFLTILFVFPGSSSGILPPHWPRPRPWWAIPRDRSAVLAAHRFKTEHDETPREMEIISKKAGIIELEWEHQRKQLLDAINGESCNLLNLNSTLN